MTDEPGVLGNLPRSRPGRRSAKRTDAAAGETSPKKSGSKRKPAARRAQRAPRAQRQRAASGAGTRPKSAPAVPPTPSATDPLTGAVRLAGRVVEAGFKTAAGIVRRLPGR